MRDRTGVPGTLVLLRSREEDRDEESDLYWCVSVEVWRCRNGNDQGEETHMRYKRGKDKDIPGVSLEVPTGSNRSQTCTLLTPGYSTGPGTVSPWYSPDLTFERFWSRKRIRWRRKRLLLSHKRMTNSKIPPGPVLVRRPDLSKRLSLTRNRRETGVGVGGGRGTGPPPVQTHVVYRRNGKSKWEVEPQISYSP